MPDQEHKLESFVQSLIFRIDGKYYDLATFCDAHPGGKNILIYAKRKAWDHTQLFSIHHVNYTKAESMMKRYLIKDESLIDRIEQLIAIEVPQYFPKQLPLSTSKYYPKYLANSGIESSYEPFILDRTDEEPQSAYSWNDLKMADCAFELPQKGSFYWELRDEVFKYFKRNKLTYYPTQAYMLFWWLTVALMVLCHILQYWYKSYVIAFITGLCYLILGGFGHQFIHNPGMFRAHSYVSLDWIGLYSYTYMVDHIIVHHIYTNTIPDNHFDGTDPFVYVNPFTPRAQWRKAINFVLANATTAFGIYGNYMLNIVLMLTGKEPFYWHIFVFPMSYVVMCCIVRDVALGISLQMFATFFSSWWYFTIALMSHNQEENWNLERLSKAAKCNDMNGGWAEMQLVTSSDIGYNYGFMGSMFCLWLNYHTVHHLLPTVDMSHHREAQQILNRVASKHGITYNYKSFWTMYWDMLETFSVPRAITTMMEKE